jgi:hypothetical protein
VLPIVTWFANDHDHSVHYFKYGLMRLARMGEIRFQELPNELAGNLLPGPVRVHKHRRTAAVRIESGKTSRLIILDGEDSIFQLSPLIQWCDVYFSCTYRRRFFEQESFDLELPWQTDCETGYYRELYYKLQGRYKDHLHRARPLMPIGAAMEWTGPESYVERKAWGLRHKFSKLSAPKIDWGIQFARFEKRWDHLMRLRALAPSHDVILKDSLWGWPRHRIALHQELARLAGDYDVRAELHYRVAEAYELGTHPAPSAVDFPMIAGGPVSGDYEEMLARSRLAVFATGFHYGCRNIVSLAWLLGIRTLTDPFSNEAIYDFEKTGVTLHQSGDWREIRVELEKARMEPVEARIARQRTFDEIGSPELAARWIVASLEG